MALKDLENILRQVQKNIGRQILTSLESLDKSWPILTILSNFRQVWITSEKYREIWTSLDNI